MEKNMKQKVNDKLEADLGTGGSFMFKKIIFLAVLINALLIIGALWFK